MHDVHLHRAYRAGFARQPVTVTVTELSTNPGRNWLCRAVGVRVVGLDASIDVSAHGQTERS
jgi:hypothetical protein